MRGERLAAEGFRAATGAADIADLPWRGRRDGADHHGCREG